MSTTRLPPPARPLADRERLVVCTFFRIRQAAQHLQNQVSGQYDELTDIPLGFHAR